MPGPINRKKNVTGKASEESVKTEGSGLGQGPVGKSDGYEDRRTQQQPSSSQRAVGGAQKPVSQQTPTTGGWSGKQQQHEHVWFRLWQRTSEPAASCGTERSVCESSAGYFRQYHASAAE